MQDLVPNERVYTEPFRFAYDLHRAHEYGRNPCGGDYHALALRGSTLNNIRCPEGHHALPGRICCKRNTGIKRGAGSVSTPWAGRIRTGETSSIADGSDHYVARMQEGGEAATMLGAWQRGSARPARTEAVGKRKGREDEERGSSKRTRDMEEESHTRARDMEESDTEFGRRRKPITFGRFKKAYLQYKPGTPHKNVWGKYKAALQFNARLRGAQ